MTSRNDATKAAILWLTVLLFVPASYGQKDNKPETTVSVRTEMVMVPAVVTDRAGVPLSNLKKEDFVLLEDNQERPITVFDEVVTDVKRVTKPRADTMYSNIVEGDVSSRRLTAIVIDFINTNFADQARGRRQLLASLKEVADGREPVAVFVIKADGVHVIQDFTADPEVLRQAIEHFRPNSSTLATKQTGAKVEPPPGASDIKKAVELPELSEAIRRMAELFTDEQTKSTGFQTRVAVTLTLEAMQQIAHALEGIPGRKSLIWVSSGFPFDIVDTYSVNAATPSDYGPPNITDSVTSVRPLYAATWRALNQAQISVYPVDIRGLQLELYIHPSIQNAGRDFRAQKSWEEQETIATFNTFADMTGGKMSTELGEAFRAAATDSSHYYMIGYYLTKNDRTPGWHKLDLKVKRADAKVRARSGFLVTKGTADVAKLEEADIQSALMSPLDFTAIPFRMQWTSRTSAGGSRVKVAFGISIAPGQLTIDDRDGNRLALELIVAAKSPDGKLLGNPQVQKLEAHLRPEMAEQIKAKGIEYGGELELEPGQYNVRILVRDELTGKMGSVAAPLTVEAWGTVNGPAAK